MTNTQKERAKKGQRVIYKTCSPLCSGTVGLLHFNIITTIALNEAAAVKNDSTLAKKD